MKECAGSTCENTLPYRGPKYCSAKCRSTSYKGRGKHVWAICQCGKQFDPYPNRSRRRYCSEECRKQFYWRPPTSDEQKAKLSAAKLGRPLTALRGYKQSEGHLIARLGTGAIRASKEELSLIPAMERLGFRHTGEGSFWRRWPDGTLHNPDFVDEQGKRVAEYFGSYWHERGEEDYARQQWAELGYDCIVIWDTNREAFLAEASR